MFCLNDLASSRKLGVFSSAAKILNMLIAPNVHSPIKSKKFFITQELGAKTAKTCSKVFSSFFLEQNIKKNETCSLRLLRLLRFCDSESKSNIISFDAEI